eukprot:TRINITY_DN3128_c1_g2_i1.p1 TRINITY_DN3128_c1_g2~~TRINITY_DN3128_c1_g2_i1.p1  ORF type:complete len:124 (+),score=9.14 TRINITY_DN3128_c1_g2_i1:388-759(+)
MSHCISLQTLDVAPLRNVTTIGHNFLSSCSSLTSVDLGLRDVASVGDKFLSCCRCLTSVDLSAMPNLTKLGGRFLSDCSSLTTVNLGTLRERVTDVGYRYMAGCNKLPSTQRKRPGKTSCSVC